MPPNLFEATESGFFTCARIRPPPAGAAGSSATAPEVVVASPRTVELATRRTHVRTGAGRSGGTDTFVVDGALGSGCSDDDA